MGMDNLYLNELKEKVELHEVDWSTFTPVETRRNKEHYTADKKVLLEKINLTFKAHENILKYEADITEILDRLKKMGFIFIKEQEPPKIICSCKTCGGEGMIRHPEKGTAGEENYQSEFTETCTTCNGTGKVMKEPPKNDVIGDETSSGSDNA